MASETPLADRLADPSRPVFLLGEVPPGEGTAPGKILEIATMFSNRSKALASDGFIVYDIQDEPGRSSDSSPRPFPFRHLMDSSTYAAVLARTSGKQCLVYKCVADEKFDDWIQTAHTSHGHSAINVVGRVSSDGTFVGPTISEAMDKVNATNNALKFGCVCIGERHTLESAQARGKSYPTEHLNMMRKQKAGAQWFVSQAIYDIGPTIQLLKDYASLCRQQGETPRKVILTFAPVSRTKTINFIKWLGVKVPEDIEKSILEHERPIDKSIDILCDHLKVILQECASLGVPLGINCESVSIFKAEIDGVHELFRRLQRILLDGRGPWKVIWVDVIPERRGRNDENDSENRGLVKSGILADHTDATVPMMIGAAMGGALVAAGILLGNSLGSQRTCNK
ncbi:methylenetetrahydrofolate reductase [Nitzschia inconspicua]|uniref:Methylenetetrahydrofolate reductase n=1 Tax=Nitzschia inconspicua TaxID=303405 RepID=A0A9K3LFA5_9STRA|nr:methylenetetrahydrofolate reductase [Nitzschia inconspicua]